MRGKKKKKTGRVDIFGSKISLSYKNFWGKFENNASWDNFKTDPSTLPLSLPHILRTIGLVLVYSKQSYA